MGWRSAAPMPRLVVRRFSQLRRRRLSTASGVMSPSRGSPTSMKRALVVVVVTLVGCSSDPCDPQKQTCTYAADVSTMTVGGGVEDENTCQSWTLNNPTELWVSTIAESNTGAYHHANWFFVPDDQFTL